MHKRMHSDIESSKIHDMTTKSPIQKPTAAPQESLKRMLSLLIILAIAWVLWSGFFKPLLLGLGLFSCVLVVYLSHRMKLYDVGAFSLAFYIRLLRYWAWLAVEVVRSSLEVTRLVLSPKLSISPTVVEFDSVCRERFDRAVLGNSITLTPGTLTLRMKGNTFTVHSLTREGAEEMLKGEMDRRVANLRSV